MILLKILGLWTVASIALGLLIGLYLKRLRLELEELEFLRKHRLPANHLPPLPEGSILGKSDQRDMVSQ